MVEGLNNFDVARNLTVPYPYAIKDAKAFIKKGVKNKANDLQFAIELKETAKVMVLKPFELVQHFVWTY